MGRVFVLFLMSWNLLLEADCLALHLKSGSIKFMAPARPRAGEEKDKNSFSAVPDCFCVVKTTLNGPKFLIVQCYLSIPCFVNAVPLYARVANSPAGEE